MRVYHRNAAELMNSRIQALSERHSSWRCIYLKLTCEERRYSNALRLNFVVNAITELLDEEEGGIYLCDDGDIFILFEGGLKSIQQKLGSHFEDFNEAQREGKPGENPFVIFDLSCEGDWHELNRLCHKKYLRAAAAYQLIHVPFMSGTA